MDGNKYLKISFSNYEFSILRYNFYTLYLSDNNMETIYVIDNNFAYC